MLFSSVDSAKYLVSVQVCKMNFHHGTLTRHYGKGKTIGIFFEHLACLSKFKILLWALPNDCMDLQNSNSFYLFANRFRDRLYVKDLQKSRNNLKVILKFKLALYGFNCWVWSTWVWNPKWLSQQNCLFGQKYECITRQFAWK